MTLAAGLQLGDRTSVESLEEAIAAHAPLAPAAFVFEAVDSFPSDEGVVFLRPVVDPDLLRWHQTIWTTVGAALIDLIPYYAPGSWVPHCTMRLGRMGPALSETADWLRANAGLPLVAPIAGVTLRTYTSGEPAGHWRVDLRRTS